MKNIVKIMAVLCFLANQTAVAMKFTFSRDPSGKLPVAQNIRAITGGINKTLKDVRTLTNPIAVVAWDNFKHNKLGSNVFDSNTLKQRYIACSIIGGFVGKTLKNIIGEDQINYYLSGPLKPFRVAFKSPFLTAYVACECIFRFNEIKKNPFPFLAEVGLLGVNAADVCDNGWIGY